MEESYWIRLDYACYGIVVKNNRVIKAPPIAGWMIDKKFDSYVKRWLAKKNATITKLK